MSDETEFQTGLRAAAASGGLPLRTVMDGLTEGFGLLDHDFTILELNSEAVRIDGRPRDALIGRSHWDVYPGTEESDVGRLYKQAMATREPVALKHRYHWPDGRTSWFETRAYPVDHRCLAVLYRDITEAHGRDAQLRASEAQFRAAVEAVDGVVWTNSPDGQLLGEQQGWAQLTGQTFEAYQGFGWTDAIHPDDARPTLDAWQRAVAAKAPFEFEHRVRRHDGEWRLCTVRAIPVFADDGAIDHWVGIHRDITESRAEAVKLGQLAETVDSVFYVHELDESRISYVNLAYERVWGRTREALYADQRNFLAVVHPDDRARLEAAMARQQCERSEPIEYRLRREDGSERVIYDRPFDTLDPITGKRRIVGLATDITDLRIVQTQLARNVATFAELITGNPFGIYVLDANLRFTLVSNGARPTFATVAPIEGCDLGAVMHTLWPDAFAEEIVARARHTLTTGESFGAPASVEERADLGTREAYDWRMDRIELPEGGYGVICHFYDLTEREASARELDAARASEAANAAQLDALYSGAPLGLALLDKDLRFVRLNDALAAMNGFPAQAHIGKSAWDLVPDLRASAEPLLRRVMETGEPLRDVMVQGRTAATGDEVRQWCEQFYPLHDRDGRVTGIGIIAEDVTAREQQVKERAEREDELRRVLDQLFAFVGVLRPDGCVTYANRTPLEAAGLLLADVAGRPFWQTAWWSHDIDVQDRLRDAVMHAAAGEIVRYDVPVRLGDALVTIDFQLAPLRDHAGIITGLIPSGVVIEERVQAEAALRQMTDNLENEVARRTDALRLANEQLVAAIDARDAAQASLLESQKLEAVGQLTAGVAHDFNNILASVLSGITLATKWSDDSRVREVLEMSASAAQRGAGLVRQLLAFARQQPLEPATIDLGKALDEARGLIGIALSSGIKLEISAATDCWPVRADPALLQSALLNLAINARDAMPSGGSLTIRASNLVGQGLARDQVGIVIRDTGGGMPPEVLARVAEPFFTTKGVGHGTGLGVAMVHGFAVQSGGSLQFESIVGVGTTVTLMLPRDRGADGETAIADGAPVIQVGATILVVDDDPHLPGLTSAILADAGHKVLAAPSGAAALALLAAMPVDVVLTDVMMPGMDGVELAERILQLPQPPSIVFMTGRADRKRLEGRIVVDKPFTPETLTRAIDQTLRGDRMASS